MSARVALPVPIITSWDSPCPSPPQCTGRKRRSLGLRHRFSAEEDRLLRELVAALGTQSWKEVAARMGGRSSRQCRERYKNYLSDSARNGPWSAEEEALLEEKYNKYGPRWSMIAGFFDSRSDANVKNHWTNIVTRRRREQLALAKKFEGGAEEADEAEDSLLALDDEMRRFDDGINNMQDMDFELGDDFFDF